MTSGTDDTRQRLLEAAGDVFAENGFEAATVREICSRANANLAAVNYHFGDKQRLYVEAVRFVHCGGDEETTVEWPTQMPPEERLREYIHRMLARMLNRERPSWHARLMAREMAEPTEACLSVIVPYIRENFARLCEILGDLLPPDVADEDLHLVAFSIVGQCLHFKIHEPIGRLLVGDEECRTHDVPRLTDHITRFTLAALGRAEPAYVQAPSPRSTGS